MFAAAPYDSDAIASLGTDRGIALQQFRVAEDRIQRAAQFVADTDDVTAFREIGCLRRLLRFLQFRIGSLMRLDFRQQQVRLSAGLALSRGPASLRQRDQPRHNAGDWQQNEEHGPESRRKRGAILDHHRRCGAVGDRERHSDHQDELTEQQNETAKRAAKALVHGKPERGLNGRHELA
jgi:hypothetical protein